MAKFCTRCGKPLIDGQPCDCMKNSAQSGGVQDDDQTVMMQHQQAVSRENAQQSNYQGNQQGNPYMNQQQGNPYMNQQQGNPYMNQQQGNPYMNQQQGNPYMNQQQGNPYMNQQQGNPYMNQQGNPYGGWQQGNPYGQQQSNFNGQWFQEKTGKFVENTKNMFAEILPLITRPDTTMKRLCDSNSSVMGLEMVGLKAVICILISLFLAAKIKNMAGGFIEMPTFRIIIFILILTVGFAYLQAAIFKGLTAAFQGDTTINKMMTAVGFSAFVDSVMILLTALFIMSFPKFAVVLMGILSMISYYFYLRGYEHAVQMKPDRKVYCFIVAQVLTIAAEILVLYILLPIIFDLPVGELGDMLESFGSFM